MAKHQIETATEAKRFCSVYMIGKRLKIVCIFIVGVCLVVPIWWKTTEVYRAPLPLHDVHLYDASQKWELFSSLAKQFPHNTHGRELKASTGYRLSFILANADPSYILPDWDFPALEQVFLRPILDKLSVIADLTVDSQVFHYASMLKAPKTEKLGTKVNYYIPSTAISQHINPNEWKLDFSTDTQPQVNFIVYIPSESHSPLKIHDEDGKHTTTNAFIIPQWGGVVIYNPTKLNHSKTNKTTPLQLGFDDLHDVFAIFVSQLKELLSGEHTPNLSSEEYDLIVKRHLSENIQTATSTLLSLSKLIDSLPNMVVLDNIQELVQTSVDSLNQAHAGLERGDYLYALQASREAMGAAELAFFDPNMLALLYFPDEHKYAVYTPILLPVFLPIISGLIQEYKHRKAKKKPKTD